MFDGLSSSSITVMYKANNGFGSPAFTFHIRVARAVLGMDLSSTLDD